ncbi:OLC1v1017017C1 [Oldenlandia corymbosa var. corymbosa]|uniref:OLC1v1017017C1 n=1 Tax=Oldenlandia corymbosa var. corymbosa TaxID=529605 RepID=A0AAV1E8H8_OLDCO|nr:OLC1v1017017C1 [Oldenlandia corymbosa var. corymbosa]
MGDSWDQNKLFVGGVSRETTGDSLKCHFEKYGAVLASEITKDRLTGLSRGFAFVTMAEPSGVESALQDSHVICGRTVEVKRAIPRSEQANRQLISRGLDKNGKDSFTTDQQNFRTKKIFVGGLSANLTEDEFKNYFEKFGRITDVVVMHDNVTRRPRGFGFITFASEDAVDEVVQNTFHKLNDKEVEVKRAVPKESSSGRANGYTARPDNGRLINYNNHPGSLPTFSPGYGPFPSYGSVPGYGGIAGYPYGPYLIGGGYPYGGYPGVGAGYGVVPWYGTRTDGPNFSTVPPPFRI